MRDFICEKCHIQFSAPMTIRGTPPRFCSIACRNHAHAKSEKKKLFICKWCNKFFEEWTYRKPDFCSNQCRSEFGAVQPRPSTRKPESYINQVCAWCGKEYITRKVQILFRNGKYCSKECKYAALSENMRGDKNKLWRGGDKSQGYRGENWGSQSRKARKRDDYTCQVCGKHYGETNTDVHHIIPYRDFDGDYLRANQLSNLIVLCRSCHSKVEHGKIPCPAPKD